MVYCLEQFSCASFHSALSELGAACPGVSPNIVLFFQNSCVLMKKVP